VPRFSHKLANSSRGFQCTEDAKAEVQPAKEAAAAPSPAKATATAAVEEEAPAKPGMPESFPTSTPRFLTTHPTALGCPHELMTCHNCAQRRAGMHRKPEQSCICSANLTCGVLRHRYEKHPSCNNLVVLINPIFLCLPQAMATRWVWRRGSSTATAPACWRATTLRRSPS